MKIWKLTITSRRSRWREQQSDDVSFQLCDTKGRIEDGQFHKMMLSELELYVNHKVSSFQSNGQYTSCKYLEE